MSEFVVTMFVLFLFIFFPMLDWAVLGMRTFFMWFACNQAVMAAAKARTWDLPVTIGGTTYQPATVKARAMAVLVRDTLIGSHFDVANPGQFLLEIVQTPIPGSGPSGTDPGSIANSTVALSQEPDTSQYVCSVQCTITGTVDPFMPLPIFSFLPGCGKPFPLRVSTNQIFENPPGLAQ